MAGFISRLRAGLSIMAPGTFSVRMASCPFCGISLFVRLNDGEAGLRCVRCAASTVHLSIGLAVASEVPESFPRTDLRTVRQRAIRRAPAEEGARGGVFRISPGCTARHTLARCPL